MVRRFGLEIAWGVFAVLNLIAMFLVPEQGTIPFHFIWVSLTLLYGYRTWDPRPTMIVLGLVILGTGFGEAHHALDWVELSEVPLMAMMFLAMVWHARRRQHAIEDLRAGAERERDFLRDASHHLRTPITIAVGHAELIRESAVGAMAVDDADVVLDELGNLGRISDRILMLATADHPEYLRLDEVDLDAMVTRFGERWSAAVDRRWEISCTSGALIDCDGDQLERAFDAVVENAVNHTDLSDVVRIETSRRDGRAVIVVADSGSSIPRAHLPHVFERFFGTNAGSRRGTGLGLAIVKSVIEAHGGEVGVASTEGVGTTVTWWLPLGNGRADRPPALPAREHAQPIE